MGIVAQLVKIRLVVFIPTYYDILIQVTIYNFCLIMRPINQLSQLSQKLKVGGKKFLGKSRSARENTSSGLYPVILRHSGDDLEILPNYA